MVANVGERVPSAALLWFPVDVAMWNIELVRGPSRGGRQRR